MVNQCKLPLPFTKFVVRSLGVIFLKDIKNVFISQMADKMNIYFHMTLKRSAIYFKMSDKICYFVLCSDTVNY